MTTEELLAHLRTLCAAPGRGVHPICLSPFAAVVDGETYLGATNGCGMLLVRAPGTADLHRLGLTDRTADVVPMIPKHRHLVPGPGLAAWAREGRKPQEACDCERGFRPLKGQCWYVEGLGEGNPEHDHFVRCDACAGSPGTKIDRSIRPGCIRGVYINRTVLDDFLPQLKDEPPTMVCIGKPEADKPVVVRGWSWIAVVMPMKHDLMAGVSVATFPKEQP